MKNKLLLVSLLFTVSVNAQKKVSDVITPDVIEFFDTIDLMKTFFESDAHKFEEQWGDAFYVKTKTYLSEFKTEEAFKTWINANISSTSFSNVNEAENFFRRVYDQQELNRKTFRELKERQDKIFEKLGDGAMELWSAEKAKRFFTSTKFKVVK